MNTPEMEAARRIQEAFGGMSHPVSVSTNPKPDPIKPAYYKAGGVDVIDVVRMFDLNFLAGNILKYVVRAGKKGNAVEDLKKAREYLDRYIAQLESNP